MKQLSQKISDATVKYIKPNREKKNIYVDSNRTPLIKKTLTQKMLDVTVKCIKPSHEMKYIHVDFNRTSLIIKNSKRCIKIISFSSSTKYFTTLYHITNRTWQVLDIKENQHKRSKM